MLNVAKKGGGCKSRVSCVLSVFVVSVTITLLD